jgi:hypothetical protein
VRSLSLRAKNRVFGFDADDDVGAMRLGVRGDIAVKPVHLVSKRLLSRHFTRYYRQSSLQSRRCLMEICDENLRRCQPNIGETQYFAVLPCVTMRKTDFKPVVEGV